MAPPSSSKPTRSRSTPPAIKAYLIAYNLAAMSLWAYALYRLVTHLAGEGQIDGAGWSIKRIFGLQSEADKLLTRSKTSYAEFGQQVKWIQTFALLEAVHAATGLVRSGLATTLMQISSRIFMVWYVCEAWTLVPISPFYSSMVFAWSVTEVIRYAHYAVGLLGVQIYALEWLRYSLFYVLYPLGAGSEATLILKSAGPARHHFGYVGYFTTVIILAAWPPSLLMMMQHMRKQRYKHLFKASTSSSTSSSTAAKKAQQAVPQVKKGIEIAAKKVEEATTTARNEGKRVTRSNSRQNLKQ